MNRAISVKVYGSDDDCTLIVRAVSSKFVPESRLPNEVEAVLSPSFSASNAIIRECLKDTEEFERVLAKLRETA